MHILAVASAWSVKLSMVYICLNIKNQLQQMLHISDKNPTVSNILLIWNGKTKNKHYKQQRKQILHSESHENNQVLCSKKQNKMKINI